MANLAERKTLGLLVRSEFLFVDRLSSRYIQ